MNFRILAVAALIPVVAGCARNVDTQAEKEKLIATDREFSAMSVEQGTVEAFMFYAADSAVMYRNRSTPISGKDAVRVQLEQEAAAGGTLSWEPTFARISESADLGYTLGSWKYSLVDSLGIEQAATGYYVTIWEKTPEGNWQWVFDSGVSGPPPEEP
ncbi:MAG: hypothetical protein PVH24_03335 [Candidatus Zixiibacteriota bacterium]